MNIDEMKKEYDWRAAFISAYTGGTVDDTSVSQIDNAVECLCADDGENDEADWIGVFLMKDGRYVIIRAGCDYTGWD